MRATVLVLGPRFLSNLWYYSKDGVINRDAVVSGCKSAIADLSVTKSDKGYLLSFFPHKIGRSLNYVELRKVHKKIRTADSHETKWLWVDQQIPIIEKTILATYKEWSRKHPRLAEKLAEYVTTAQ